MALDFERQMDTVDCAVRELQGLLRFLDIFLKDGELIASHASDDVRVAHDALQSLGNDRQQLVADRMTEAVIDRLEPIEVQVVHRKTSSFCVAFVHGYRYAF
ncbi:MAG: hypothetical protein ABIR55_04060, partial [Burkholderiaceae bacterium]